MSKKSKRQTRSKSGLSAEGRVIKVEAFIHHEQEKQGREFVSLAMAQEYYQSEA